MNKVLKFFAMGAMAAAFTLPSLAAEAGNLALLPLINNVAARDDLQQIYYDRAVEATKISQTTDLVDGADYDKVLAKYTKNGVLPDQAACEAICRDANVDYVFCYQVDDLRSEDVMFDNNGEQDTYIILEGKTVSYDAATGKFKVNKIYSKDKIVYSLNARYDIEGETFGNSVTRETKRLLGVKKVSIERPRISGAGLRGNR